MDERIIAAIRRRLRSKTIDLGPSNSQLNPADPTVIANDERQLGFALPPLLIRIFVEIGNGGFGPGYGLIGLTNGVPNDMGRTAPEIYSLFQSPNREDPNWTWPRGLLPICHWGCAILSCVDCADANFRMRIFDPNVHGGSNWADAFFEESAGFEKWIRDWASGVKLWDVMYGDDGHIARILAKRRALH